MKKIMLISDCKGEKDGGITKEEFEELKKFYAGEPPAKKLPEGPGMLCLGENYQVRCEEIQIRRIFRQEKLPGNSTMLRIGENYQVQEVEIRYMM